MVPKATLRDFKGLSTKKFFPPKINQDRVANNVFDLQNDFLEDRLSFLVYGEKINWVILGLFEARRTKSLNFLGGKVIFKFANFPKFSQIFANSRKLSQKLRRN